MHLDVLRPQNLTRATQVPIRHTAGRGAGWADDAGSTRASGRKPRAAWRWVTAAGRVSPDEQAARVRAAGPAASRHPRDCCGRGWAPPCTPMTRSTDHTAKLMKRPRGRFHRRRHHGSAHVRREDECLPRLGGRACRYPDTALLAPTLPPAAGAGAPWALRLAHRDGSLRGAHFLSTQDRAGVRFALTHETQLPGT